MEPTGATDEQVVEAHRAAFGDEPELLVRAPGRVSLLGGHLDYNEGFVLPVAIDRHLRATLSRRRPGAAGVRVHSINFHETCQFIPGRPNDALPLWARYLRGVVEEVREAGHLLGGFDLLLAGEIPIGSGLSSSASLSVAGATLLDRGFGLDLDPLALVRLCRHAEERHAGVGCGIMDPFASYLGRRGHALLLDCRSLEHEEVPLPAGVRLVVLDTRVRRTLAGSDFATRRHECERAVQQIRRLLGEPVASLRDVDPDRLITVIDRMDPALRLRAAHVVSEMSRAVRGADALRAGRLDVFGEAMFETHASLRELYQVSIPELDLLVETARSVPGVIGARLTGAGFGGCVVAVVRDGAVEELTARATRRFATRFGAPPQVILCASADGARRSVRRLR